MLKGHVAMDDSTERDMIDTDICNGHGGKSSGIHATYLILWDQMIFFKIFLFKSQSPKLLCFLPLPCNELPQFLAKKHLQSSVHQRELQAEQCVARASLNSFPWLQGDRCKFSGPCLHKTEDNQSS